MKIFDKVLEFGYNYLVGTEISKIRGVEWLFSYIISTFNIKLFTKTNGLKIRVLATSDHKLLWYTDKYYRPDETLLFDSIVKEGMKVVDIGASLGFYTLRASKKIGNKGIVYSFEPDPIRFEALVDAIKINKLQNVKAFQLAVSDSCKKKCLHLTNTSSGASFSSNVKGEADIEIETIDLDSFLNTTDIDIVKIDVEGAELEVLLSMKNILAKGNVKIICEVYPNLLLSLNYSSEKIVNILNQYNYNIYLIGAKELIAISEITERRHYLFTKEMI